MNKTYILKKDLPDVKAGAKFIWQTDDTYTPFNNGTRCGYAGQWATSYPREVVETNTEFFAPETDLMDDIIEEIGLNSVVYEQAHVKKIPTTAMQNTATNC